MLSSRQYVRLFLYQYISVLFDMDIIPTDMFIEHCKRQIVTVLQKYQNNNMLYSLFICSRLITYSI